MVGTQPELGYAHTQHRQLWLLPAWSSAGLDAGKGDVLPARPPASAQPPPFPTLPSTEGFREPRRGPVEVRRWEVDGVDQGCENHLHQPGEARHRGYSGRCTKTHWEKAPFPRGLRALRATCHRDDFSQDAVASPPLAASNSGAARGSEPCSAVCPRLRADAAEQHL